MSNQPGARLTAVLGHLGLAPTYRRAGQAVTNRQAYRAMKDHGLLHKRRPRTPELHQAAKLYELLPQQPNDLWQMDVTYVHIAGYGWWYVITVIDYYSRYLLAAHFTSSYCAAEAIAALVPEDGGDPLTPQDVYVSGCPTRIPKWQGWARGAKARLDALLAHDLERAVS